MRFSFRKTSSGWRVTLALVALLSMVAAAVFISSDTDGSAPAQGIGKDRESVGALVARGKYLYGRGGLRFLSYRAEPCCVFRRPGYQYAFWRCGVAQYHAGHRNRHWQLDGRAVLAINTLGDQPADAQKGCFPITSTPQCRTRPTPSCPMAT